MPFPLPNIPPLDLSSFFGVGPNEETKPPTKGLKLDDGKLQHHLVDFAAHNEMVAVLTHGAIKYEPGNWAKVEGWEDRYFDAAIRHLISDRMGEHVDADTGGLLSLACAACCVHFLLAMRLRGHPDLAASLRDRLKASIEKARELRAKRIDLQREAEHEIARVVVGPEIADAIAPSPEKERRKKTRRKPRAAMSKGDRRRPRPR